MKTESRTLMVVFLLLILIFALFITFLLLNIKKTTESYNNYKPFFGRAPNTEQSCCGNLDWYLGSEKYNQLCNSEENMQEYFGNLQENLSGSSNQDECQKMGLKPADNPSICAEEDSYNLSANCKCVDNKNNCKLCYDKIKYYTDRKEK